MKVDVKNTMQIHSRAKVDFYKTYLETHVSILCQSQYIKHIDHLRKLDASIKFLSCEPLIEDLEDLNLQGIDWVIVGGESGPKARPMQLDWVVNIKQQVELQGSAFFFKQWGTWGSDGIKRNKHANGKLLMGEVIQQMPEKKVV
jgi:protein gp37